MRHRNREGNKIGKEYIILTERERESAGCSRVVGIKYWWRT